MITKLQLKLIVVIKTILYKEHAPKYLLNMRVSRFISIDGSRKLFYFQKKKKNFKTKILLVKLYNALSKLNRSARHVVRKTRRKYDYDKSTCAPEPSKLPEGHRDVI